jgi:hypothetical protein
MSERQRAFEALFYWITLASRTTKKHGNADEKIVAERMEQFLKDHRDEMKTEALKP